MLISIIREESALIMMTREQIKERSKAQLGSNIFGNLWLMALLVCFVYSAIISAASAITYSVGAIILAGPLSYGLSWVMLGLARGSGAVKVEDLFKGFTNDFGKNLILGVMISIYTFLWSLLFVIPGIVKAYAYSMAYYIRLDHPEYDWSTCIKESERMMDGHKADLFVQDLSFIGWFIVGGLCLGIGTLWVYPYCSLARANFYESVRAQYAQRTAQQPVM